MDTQTVLNVILSIVTVYLAARNFLLTSRKDVQRESEEMTEIRVKLKQVMDLLQDMQKDIKTSAVDFRELSKKVAIMETELKTAFKRIDELKEKVYGQHS